MNVRTPIAADRDAVHDALVRCAAFTTDEVQIALAMFDEALAGDYTLAGVDEGGVLRGYVLLGHAGITERSWYLYWICVHPDLHGRGAAQLLQRAAEDLVRAGGGDKLVLETSGRASYARSRRFYESVGFTPCGRIADFYRAGDDCLIYCKAL